MTPTQAKHLLDMRRAGADMPQIVVIRALELTGDIDPEDYQPWTRAFASESWSTANGFPSSTATMPSGRTGNTASYFHGWSCE